jgi:beta-galactosidase
LSYILVEALDADGNLCPLAHNPVRFELQGPAVIAGVGNGNPLSTEPFQAASRKLFYGKAMLILRSLEGDAGEVRVTARADGLSSTSSLIHVK